MRPEKSLGVFLIFHFSLPGSTRSGDIAYICSMPSGARDLISAAITSLNVPGYDVDSFIIKADFFKFKPSNFAA